MGVYIHWPFCKSRCSYCDFNTYLYNDLSFDEDMWVDAYIRVLDYYVRLLPDKEVTSIFFGGGTPSLLCSKSVARLISHVLESWKSVEGLEITLEANPTSVETSKLEGFAQAGVNRLSLGVQSLRGEALSFLGRTHSVSGAMKALEAVAALFPRYNFDLIYARPGQSLKEWEAELEEAVSLGASHMSLYQLTIAEKTLLSSRGYSEAKDDVAAQFYHLTQEIMDGAGIPAYEVSNYAVKGQECRHNLVYWHMADYIGIGAGAHGRYSLVEGDERYATRDIRKPARWLKAGYVGIDAQKLSREERFYEALLMGMRLYDGVSLRRLEALSGLKAQEMLDFDKVQKAQQEGWLVYDEGVDARLRASREGMLRLDSLIGYVIL